MAHRIITMSSFSEDNIGYLQKSWLFDYDLKLPSSVYFLIRIIETMPPIVLHVIMITVTLPPNGYQLTMITVTVPPTVYDFIIRVNLPSSV